MPDTGPFVSHELRVPDLDEAVRFYGAVFGWAFEDDPWPSRSRTGGS